MKTQAALDHFQTKAAITRALGISSAAVAQWGEVVPLESATALEIVTRGQLRVDRSLYPALARAVSVAGDQAA